MTIPRSNLSDALRQTIWAQCLTPLQMQHVETKIIEQQVPAGGYICHRGEKVESWVGVIDGLVKINNLSLSGKSVTFTGVPTGGWFGEGSMLKDEPRKYDVIALRDSRIARMPGSTFRWLLDHSLPFTQFLLMQLNERLGQFIATVEYDRLLCVDARVARCLAGMFNPHLYPGSARQLQISQEEIGYLSGTSRQRVNQALQVLEKAGLLQVDYGGIQIVDVNGLRNFHSS